MGWIDIFTQLGKLKWIYELKYINNRYYNSDSSDITATGQLPGQ